MSGVMSGAWSAVSTALSWAVSLATSLYSGFGITGILLGAFFIHTVNRFLLIPIIGGVVHAGQSDVVRRITSSGKSDKAKQNQPVKDGGNKSNG